MHQQHSKRLMGDIRCLKCGRSWNAYKVFHDFWPYQREMLLNGQKCPFCAFSNRPKTVKEEKVKLLKDDVTIMQILEVFSDGKSHNWEAVANKLKLSYNTVLHCLRKLEAQGKLYRVVGNCRYKLNKGPNLRSSTRALKKAEGRILKDEHAITKKINTI